MSGDPTQDMCIRIYRSDGGKKVLSSLAHTHKAFTQHTSHFVCVCVCVCVYGTSGCFHLEVVDLICLLVNGGSRVQLFRLQDRKS